MGWSLKLTIQASTGTYIGSGTILPTGRHVLTAAHNVTGAINAPIGTVFSVSAMFELPSGNSSIAAAAYVVQPSWNGDPLLGNDLAIIELVSEAPSEAPRFDIYRGSSELFSIGEKAGYGQSGQGIVSISAGVKREGLNRWEIYLSNSPPNVLIYDFDSGSPSNDTLNLIAGITDTGLGSDEVQTAPGDSGGPTLLNGQIAGVT